MLRIRVLVELALIAAGAGCAPAAPAAAPTPVPSATLPRALAATPRATPAACLGSVAGKVYDDADRNLQAEPGEAGLANARIELENSEGALVQTAVTDPGGAYALGGLPSGSYSIQETAPPGFVETGESRTFVAVRCGAAATLNFVNVPLTVAASAATAPAPAPTASPTVTATAGSSALTWVVSNAPVTGLFVDPAGDIYYGTPASIDGVGNPFQGNFALWKKPANGPPIELTPYGHNLIGGIVTYDGDIYFDEAGSLDRIPDDDQFHQQVEYVLKFPVLSTIYGHLNSTLALSEWNGTPILLVSVGSRIDSNYDGLGHPSGIQPPYYEDFPTGRILFANLPWLETTHNYAVTKTATGQVYEYARGVRNPWGLTVGEIDGSTHIYAVDNDPAFRPEKYDDDPQNAGDELNDIVFGVDYGHPFYYGGEEPPPDRKPIAVFDDGSVPSGVAIADGRLFVSLYEAKTIVEVDPTNPDYKRSWRPVLSGVDAFALAASGSSLYLGNWQGIRVIDVNNLE